MTDVADLCKRLRATRSVIGMTPQDALEAADMLERQEREIERLKDTNLRQSVQVAAKLDELEAYREALQTLCAEVSGLPAFEWEVRQAIGNTNYNVLIEKLHTARSVLKGDRT